MRGEPLEALADEWARRNTFCRSRCALLRFGRQRFGYLSQTPMLMGNNYKTLNRNRRRQMLRRPRDTIAAVAAILISAAAGAAGPARPGKVSGERAHAGGKHANRKSPKFAGTTPVRRWRRALFSRAHMYTCRLESTAAISDRTCGCRRRRRVASYDSSAKFRRVHYGLGGWNARNWWPAVVDGTPAPTFRAGCKCVVKLAQSVCVCVCADINMHLKT